LFVCLFVLFVCLFVFAGALVHAAEVLYATARARANITIWREMSGDQYFNNLEIARQAMALAQVSQRC